MTCDLRDDPIAIARTVEIGRSHATAKLQAPIRGRHPTDATVHLERAEKGVHSTCDHAFDFEMRILDGFGQVAHRRAVGKHDVDIHSEPLVMEASPVVVLP